MIAVAFGLLFAGAGVGIHLEQYGGIQLEQATEVLEGLARAIEEETGVRPVLDDPLWPSCQSGDRCVVAIRDRTKSDEVVLVVVFGAPTKLRLIAERPSSLRSKGEKIELDVPRDRSGWQKPLARVAQALFPEGKVALATAPAVRTDKPPPAGVNPTPFLTLGAGALALSVGTVFAVVSQNERSSIETKYMSTDEYESTLHKMRATALTADILFVVAAACTIAGIVLIMGGDEH